VCLFNSFHLSLDGQKFLIMKCRMEEIKRERRGMMEQKVMDIKEIRKKDLYQFMRNPYVANLMNGQQSKRFRSLTVDESKMKLKTDQEIELIKSPNGRWVRYRDYHPYIETPCPVKSVVLYRYRTYNDQFVNHHARVLILERESKGKIVSIRI